MAILAEPVISTDRLLQLALRRLVSAGSRGLTEDRLVDLTIAAEALFIHGAGHTNHKRTVIAEGAEVLLGGDPEFGVSGPHIHRFIVDAYKRRNHEVHADPTPPSSVRLLNGDLAPSIEETVADLKKLMRRALTLTVHRTVPVTL